MGAARYTVYDSDGLVAIATVGAVQIQLPPIANVHQCLAVAAGLQAIHEKSPNGISWVVNASALTELPILLVSVLVGFEREFCSQGRQLTVVGVRPELAPPPHLDTGSLFSAGEGPEARNNGRNLPET